MLKRKVKSNMTSNNNLFLLFFLVIFSNNILAQEKCQFEIIDTFYCDTAYLYTIKENNKFVQYIDFNTKDVLDSTTLFNLIQQRKIDVYLPPPLFNVMIISSKKYLWRGTRGSTSYDLIEIRNFPNYKVDKIINKIEYVRFTLSGANLSDYTYANFKKFKDVDCLLIYSSLNYDLELVKSPIDADHPPK